MREIRFSIPMRTPLMNEWQRMHWGKRSSLSKIITLEVSIAAHEYLRKPPITFCDVLIERYSSRPPDHDGLVGGVKPLLDALTARHPKGLGIIEDDSPRVIRKLKVRHVSSKQRRTDITIREKCHDLTASGDA